MKSIVLTCCMAFLLNAAGAQNCDIALSSLAVFNEANTAQVSAINIGEDANFRYSIVNSGSNQGCSIPANSVRAVFSFPTLAGNVKPYVYDGPNNFVSGYFSWTYNSVKGVLEGRNTMAIPKDMGDLDIAVKVRGNAGAEAAITLNLSQLRGISDNVSNNYGGAHLLVTSNPLPIKLASFTATPDKCDVLLNWKTSSEYNFSHFELEYSPDAVTYIKIGTIQAKNVSAGSAYSSVYTQLSGNGYYRLKMVEKDGRAEYSTVARANTSCDKGKILVYPNPVNFDQQLKINITGYTGKLKAEFFDAAGKLVQAYQLQSNNNVLTVKNFSAGVYMLYVRTEAGEVQSFKVIVTR